MRNVTLSDEMAAARAEGRKTVTRRLTSTFRPGDVCYHGEALVEDRAKASYRRDRELVWLGLEAWDWKRSVLPARFCPERCARMWSLIRDVRQERLHAITEEDAEAEGVTLIGDVGCPCEGPLEEPGPHLVTCPWSHEDVDPDTEPHRAAFAVIWDKLHGKDAPWGSNPLVWRIDLGEPLTREQAHEFAKARVVA